MTFDCSRAFTLEEVKSIVSGSVCSGASVHEILLSAVEFAYKVGENNEREACIETLDINGAPDKHIDLLRIRRPVSTTTQAMTKMTEPRIPVPPADLLDTTCEAFASTEETGPWPPWSDEELGALRPLWEWGYRRGVEASCDWIEESGIDHPADRAEELRCALLGVSPARIKAEALALLSQRIGDGMVKMINDRERELLLTAVQLIPIRED